MRHSLDIVALGCFVGLRFSKNCNISEQIDRLAFNDKDEEGISENDFIISAHPFCQELTRDDVKLIYKSAKGKLSSSAGNSKNYFYILEEISRQCLEVKDGKWKIRLSELSRFKRLSRFLGEDVLFASINLRGDMSYSIDSFAPHCSFGSLVPLQNLHENHAHLWASSGIFDLNWMFLMNHMDLQRAVLAKLKGERLSHSGFVQDGDLVLPLVDVVYYASILRVYLFAIVNNDLRDIEMLAPYVWNLEFSRIGGSDIDRQIGRVRRRPNFQVIDDYAEALLSDLPRASSNAPQGEKALINASITFIALNGNEYRVVELLHLYVSLRSRARMEVIQCNGLRGFGNFQLHQKRKNVALYGDRFKAIAVKQATHSMGTMSSIELRIAPKTDVIKLANEIRNIDHWSVSDDLSSSETRKDWSETVILAPKHFYVLHFIKGVDEEMGYDGLGYRHMKFRMRKLKEADQILALRRDFSRKKLLSANTSIEFTGSRVFGIDAASSEIGCRPEVFGHVFRYLRSRHPWEDQIDSFPLGATYHVGEDFSDLLDGIRAVDEAIEFLDLRAGDRLGHALSIGLNPGTWYERRNGRVFKLKQDHLDDMIWAYIQLLRIGQSEVELEWMIGHISPLFRYVLGIPLGECDSLRRDKIIAYYNSWLLRGDNPEYYLNPLDSRRCARPSGDIYTQEEIRNNEDLNELRSCSFVRQLLIRYQTDQGMKLRGQEMIELQIDRSYVEIVHRCQEMMISKLSRKDIRVESNPTSNMMIGGLRSYIEHPIFRWCDPLKLPCDWKLNVSINTDDWGVFNTNLESEFYLLAEAVLHPDQWDQEPIDSSIVNSWLRAIVRNGRSQTFRVS